MRRCQGCGAALAADNTASICGKCHREQRDQLRTPPTQLSRSFFETPEFQAAFESHHIGKVFKAYRNHPRHLKLFGKGLNQDHLGRWLGLNQSQVSRIENGPPEQNITILTGYARALHLPPELLWFAFPGQRLARFTTAPIEAAPADTDTGFVPNIQDADSLIAQIVGSSSSNDAVSQLSYATSSIAESHTQAPARHVMTQVYNLHEQAQILLGMPNQRLSQKRELYRIESELLAHSCLLLDDLRQNGVAQKYGAAALIFAKEGGVSEATARTALAKALRWAERLIESADMARIGYEQSPSTPIRIQLASQEANASALMGNIPRAREALNRAGIAADSVSQDSGESAWSFPVARQAIFALSVALQARDPEAAIEAVARADASWATGAPLVSANWAQIRIGAGIANLLKGSLDATIEEVAPVLELSPELRISTVTAYMRQLEQELCDPRFRGNGDVLQLRQDIKEFDSGALSIIRLPEPE
ncbi:MAG TPA: helix-turn-helix transcriptional regulator [Pseudonocardiaceae bacterium]|nr:helix-turn-helix transcriptional regulator [Pseudonocardiaceae bacterium]